jgi:hypothetical protein
MYVTVRETTLAPLKELDWKAWWTAWVKGVNQVTVEATRRTVLKFKQKPGVKELGVWKVSSSLFVPACEQSINWLLCCCSVWWDRKVIVNAHKNLEAEGHGLFCCNITTFASSDWENQDTRLPSEDSNRMRVYNVTVTNGLYYNFANESRHDCHIFKILGKNRNDFSNYVLWILTVARIEDKMSYMISVGKRLGKRLLGRPRIRWEDNIMMCVTETGCEDRM